MLVRFLLSVFLFFVCLSYVRSECTYVSMKGNDNSGNGTAEEPYLTLQRAFVTNENLLQICILAVPTENNTFNGQIDLGATTARSIWIYGNGTESEPITIDSIGLETIITRDITLSGVTIRNAFMKNFDRVTFDQVWITNINEFSDFLIWANKEIILYNATTYSEITLSANSVDILYSQIYSSISIYAYDVTKGLTISNSHFAITPAKYMTFPQFTIYSDLSISQTDFTNFLTTITINCYSDCTVYMDHVKIQNNNVTVFSFVNVYTLNLVSVETNCYPDNPNPPFRTAYSSQPLNILSTDPNSQCQIVCGAGSYSPYWLVPCISCPPGTSKSVQSAENCVPCPPGSFADQSGESSCTQCLEYTYTNVYGSLWCSACDYGQKANPNNTGCVTENPPVVPTKPPTDPDESFLTPLWICFGIWLFLFVLAVGFYCFMRSRSRDDHEISKY